MTAFLDTNVLIALLKEEDLFHAWAVENFSARKEDGPVIVSDIVYCEASVALESKQDLDQALSQLGIDRIPESDEALFRAGRAFKTYRDKNKGPKLGVLPDFIIGAIAETESIPLLTTNAKDFTGYFPEVDIVAPIKNAQTQPNDAAE